MNEKILYRAQNLEWKLECHNVSTAEITRRVTELIQREINEADKDSHLAGHTRTVQYKS